MALIPNTELAEAISCDATSIKLVEGYDEICDLVREPSQVFLRIGTETVIVTSCLGWGRMSVLRGADDTCAKSWPQCEAVTFYKAVVNQTNVLKCDSTVPVCDCTTTTGA